MVSTRRRTSAVAEDPFAYLLAADRLRAHARAGGVLLALSVLVPVALPEGDAGFLWQELGGLPLSQAFVALAPAVAGLLLLAAHVIRRPPLLALVASVAPGAVVLSAWSARVLVPSAREDAWLPSAPLSVLAVALLIAGVHVASFPHARRISRAMLVAATASTLAYFVSPWLDASPWELLARAAYQAIQWPSVRGIASVLMISPFALWPLVAVTLGWVHALRKPPTQYGLPVLIAVFGMPAMLLPAVSAALAGRREEADALALVTGGVVVPLVLLTLMAHGLAFAARWEGRSPPHPEGSAASPRNKRLLWAGAVLLAATAAPCLLHRPVQAIPTWRPRAPDAQGDKLFRDLIPPWNDTGAPRSARTEPSTAMREELTATAESLDSDVGEALGALVRATYRGSLTERSWTRLVREVNDASRGAALPYYLDPTEVVVDPRDPANPWFRVDTYRIERTRRCAADGRIVSTLHLRRLTPGRTHRGSLGMSRDSQPYCLVVADQIEAYAQELRELASAPTLRGAPQSEDGTQARLAFARALAEVLESGSLEADLTASVERHELQHQLDGPRMPIATLMSLRAPTLAPPVAARLNRELSAYLAQMSAPGGSARLTLVRLVRIATIDPGKLEAWAADLALEALTGREPGVGEYHTALAFLELSALDATALSERAGRAWQAQYGAALQRLECEDIALVPTGTLGLARPLPAWPE